jgi:hypothetical protein
MTQSRLRSRGTEKFGEFAAGMLFTPDGLEQSTRLAIAARHAHRYAAAGVRDVYDLGCGLGADAMAFAGLDLTSTPSTPTTRPPASPPSTCATGPPRGSRTVGRGRPPPAG